MLEEDPTKVSMRERDEADNSAKFISFLSKTSPWTIWSHISTRSSRILIVYLPFGQRDGPIALLQARILFLTSTLSLNETRRKASVTFRSGLFVGARGSS